MTDEKRLIIFFDGVCHLCNSFVDFLIRRDVQHLLFFAPLQGETAAKMLSSERRTELSTLIFFDRGQLHIKSTAVLRALAAMGGWTKVFLLLLSIPRPIRDWIYDLVAKYRYKIFGKNEICRMPEPHERAYFLP